MTLKQRFCFDSKMFLEKFCVTGQSFIGRSKIVLELFGRLFCLKGRSFGKIVELFNKRESKTILLVLFSRQWAEPIFLEKRREYCWLCSPWPLLQVVSAIPAMACNTAWKLFKYGFFSSPYFPVFGLNARKYELEKTPYLDSFHAV